MDTSCKRFGVPIFACNSCVWNHWRYTSCSNPCVADAVAWVFSSCLISCRPSCSSPRFLIPQRPFGCIWLFSFSSVILGTCCSCTSKTFKRNEHQFEVHSTFWCLLPSLKLILSNQHVHPSHPLPTNTVQRRCVDLAQAMIWGTPWGSSPSSGQLLNVHNSIHSLKPPTPKSRPGPTWKVQVVSQTTCFLGEANC